MTETAVEPDRKYNLPLIALGCVIAAAVAARACLLWRTPMVPGMNGGYYLVQARALLEHGGLGIPDLPLTFMLQAAVAKLLQWVTGRGLEPSILLSVRLCDSLLPPLAAIPVFLLGREWCVRAGVGAWRAVVAAAVVVLGLPALTMVGDFEKNSLGLVGLAGLVLALHAWMARRTRRNALTVAAVLGLIGLTHIGVFGAALLLTALVWGADLVLAGRKGGWKHLRHVIVVAAASAAAIAVVAGLVLWKFDPARVKRLAGAVSNPVDFLENGGHPGGRGPGGPGGMRPDRAGPGMRLPSGGRGPGGFGGPGGGPGMPPGGPPGAPGALMLPEWAVLSLFGLMAAGACVLPLRGRRDVPHADRAAAIGCAVCLAVLAGPWVGGDVAPRLRLIAVIPAAFAGLYALVHLPGRWTAPAAAALMLAVVAPSSASVLSRGGHPIISEDAFAELKTLAAKVAKPERTLVVARHGLEWWTAWTLHTHVAQERALTASDWKKYDEVLFIQEKRGAGGGMPSGRGAGPGLGPRAMPPDGFGDGPPPGMGGPPARDGFASGPPPDFDDPFGPGFGGGPTPFDDDFGAGPGGRNRSGRDGGGFGGRPGGPGGGPMMDAAIPSDAEILHDGTHFRLARVRQPPSGLDRRRHEDPFGGP